MISVISSYCLDPEAKRASMSPKASDHLAVLPDLAEVCRDLYARSFLGIDVSLTRKDLENACRNKGRNQCERVRNAATTIENRIRACTESPMKGNISVPLQVCALATNFSAISSIRAKTRYRELAIEYLAVCLIVAHRLGTRAVEIVCGSRLHMGTRGRVQYFTSLRDNEVVDRIRKRFAKGVYESFTLAEEALGLGMWPRTAVAIEMEPDVTALARNLRDTQLLLSELDALATEEQREHFGINLDWGHMLLAADRRLHRNTASPTFSNDYEAANWFVNQIIQKRLRHRVIHAHVSDHYPGAHRADAAIGTFRPLKAYLPFFIFHGKLIQDWAAEKKTVNEFFSGAVAIELEARQDPGLAVRSRERLYELREMAWAQDEVDTPEACDIETEKDRLRMVEQRIARAGKAEGWLQGINRTIYDALSDLDRYTPQPDEERTHECLLDRTMLQLIREFLSSQEPDARTQRAVKVADAVLKKLGADILTYWLCDLLDEEWERSFYEQYRDHTVHSVYVYLLGLYFYVASGKIRALINAEDNKCANDRNAAHPAPDKEFVRPTLLNKKKKPSFFAKWAITALTHDIGYPFEAGGDALKKARTKLLQTIRWFVPHISILPKAAHGLDRAKISKEVITINEGLLEKLGISDEVRGEFDFRTDLFFLPGEQEENLTGRALSSHNRLSQNIDQELEEEFLCCKREPDKPTPLMQVFDLYRKFKPNAKPEKPRPEFLDHGFLSAAVLSVLVDVCRQWTVGSKKGNSYCDKALKYLGRPSLPKCAKEMASNLSEWQQRYLASKRKDIDALLKEVYFAVMTHNVTPERSYEKKLGFLYQKTFKNAPPILRVLQKQRPDYEKLPVLAFLLPLCDIIHEWHRFGFSNPIKLPHKTLSAIEVESSLDKNDIICFRYNTDFVDEETKLTFQEYKEAELTRRFGKYWRRFVRLDEPYLAKPGPAETT